MQSLLVIVFLTLALSSGLLVGWGLNRLIPRPKGPGGRSLGILVLGILLGAVAAGVYFAGLRGLDVTAGDSQTGRPKVTINPPWEKFQFEFDQTQIPRAGVDEPIRDEVSFPAALTYLDSGTDVWNRKYKCISCHVSGSYLLLRPALSDLAGPPPATTRKFFLDNLEPFVGKQEEIMLLSGNRSAQVVWAAAGLAAWDTYVKGSLSPETDSLLRCMFRLQQEDGAWLIPDCWPPLQSHAYQLATVAALATATAPGWLNTISDPDLKSRIRMLQTYLRDTLPPHDYARVWLLWSSTKLPDVLDPDSRDRIIQSIWRLQHEDGGWALRDFAAAGEWSAGPLKVKLEADPAYGKEPSDGHMTGLAVCALVDAGIPVADPRIQSAAEWLLANQRESGRWWSRSLNTDTYHFLTYSATSFALSALAKCNRFPSLAGRPTGADHVVAWKPAPRSGRIELAPR